MKDKLTLNEKTTLRALIEAYLVMNKDNGKVSEERRKELMNIQVKLKY